MAIARTRLGRFLVTALHLGARELLFHWHLDALESLQHLVSLRRDVVGRPQHRTR